MTSFKNEHLLGLQISHLFEFNEVRILTSVVRTIFDLVKVSLKPQAPAEVWQTFHSNPPLANMLRWSAGKIIPFQFCQTSSEPRESTSGEKAA